jgi:hypothetical protein
MPLVVVDHARVESEAARATTGTAELSASFVALAAVRTQADPASAPSAMSTRAVRAGRACVFGLVGVATAVMRDRITSSEW